MGKLAHIMNFSVSMKDVGSRITDKELGLQSDYTKRIGHTKPYEFKPTLNPKDPEHKEEK